MSIRRYLVLMLLSIITLVIFVSAIEGYKASMNKAESLFDDELVSLAQVISAIELPKGIIKHKITSNFAYQVIVDSAYYFIGSSPRLETINITNASIKKQKGK